MSLERRPRRHHYLTASLIRRWSCQHQHPHSTTKATRNCTASCRRWRRQHLLAGRHARSARAINQAALSTSAFVVWSECQCFLLYLMLNMLIDENERRVHQAMCGSISFASKKATSRRRCPNLVAGCDSRGRRMRHSNESGNQTRRQHEKILP